MVGKGLLRVNGEEGLAIGHVKGEENNTPLRASLRGRGSVAGRGGGACARARSHPVLVEC